MTKSTFSRWLTPVLFTISFSAIQFAAINIATATVKEPKKARPQYKHGEIEVPAAAASEPLRKTVSAKLADQYLRQELN